LYKKSEGWREKLRISEESVKVINDSLTGPDNKLIKAFLQIIEKYAGADEELFRQA